MDAEQFGVYEAVAASALAFALEEGDADDAAAAADAEAYLTRLVDSMRATPTCTRTRCARSGICWKPRV